MGNFVPTQIENKKMMDAYGGLSPDAILDRLDPEQREVATSLRGPVVVLAGAGTGKTRAITHRIAYGVRAGIYRSSSILAVTFTARAAGEMRSRLRELGAPGVQAKTFHSAALSQLKYFWPVAVGGPMPEIIEAKGRYIGEAARNVGVKIDSVSIRDLAQEIEWAKVSLIDPDNYVMEAAKQGRAPVSGFSPEQIAAVALGYENLKERRSLIDFEDMLAILGGILEENSTVAQQVRAQYQHFIVDEYQDVSPLQQYVLDQWLGGRESLCVVGDPSQTIYSFTGATPKFLLGFRRKYQNAKEIRLIRDYRSTPQVVRLANTILKEGKVEGALELVAQRKPGPQPEFKVYQDDDSEARAIAAQAKTLIADGTPASEIAILYRTKAQSQAFEAALSGAGVGFQLKGSERFFNRPEVRQALQLLAASVNHSAEGYDMAQLVRTLLSEIGWAPQPPAPSGAMRERWDSMCALVSLSDQLASKTSISFAANMRDLVADLQERAAHQNAPTIDGVTLATLHSAKGLEWDAVFLAGMSEGLLPISLADSPELVAEERRLLYVGVTRARQHLEVSYAKAKTGGRANRKPSRFLAHYWEPPALATKPANATASNRIASSSASTTRQTGNATTRSEKTNPTPLSSADLEVFEVLRKWRAQAAKEMEKPTFTILPDAALVALAQTRPADETALIQIPGIGPVKLERFGSQLLKILAEC